MTLYCRPVLIENHDDETRILCLCGRDDTRAMLQARRAYYQHNPNSEPIPMPHTHYAPRITEKPPEPHELRELRIEHQVTRRRWPDERDRQIARCTSCGSQTWRGQCRVAGCWAVMARNERTAA